MRFLKIMPNGDLVLTKQLHKPDIPPYAILSHTWGDDQDEVSIHDLRQGKAQMKAGWRKIQFCWEQARRDDISHFWIDTCCINQDDKREVDSAVNKMWRWYRNSTKCYVFLSDVDSKTGMSTEDFWESAKESRWFTRGWTLQELLAPKEVYFFDCNGKSLGSKEGPSMYYRLLNVTGIPSRVFEGRRMTSFSVQERFRWASCRVTKREEDIAYCLLGIFNIRMPLMYGEGMVSALTRLYRQVHRKERQKLSLSGAKELEEILQDFCAARYQDLGHAPDLPGILQLQSLATSSTTTSTVMYYPQNHWRPYTEPWQQPAEWHVPAASRPSIPSDDDDDEGEEEEQVGKQDDHGAENEGDGDHYYTYDGQSYGGRHGTLLQSTQVPTNLNGPSGLYQYSRSAEYVKEASADRSANDLSCSTCGYRFQSRYGVGCLNCGAHAQPYSMMPGTNAGFVESQRFHMRR